MGDQQTCWVAAPAFRSRAPRRHASIFDLRQTRVALFTPPERWDFPWPGLFYDYGGNIFQMWRAVFAMRRAFHVLPAAEGAAAVQTQGGAFWRHAASYMQRKLVPVGVNTPLSPKFGLSVLHCVHSWDFITLWTRATRWPKKGLTQHPPRAFDQNRVLRPFSFTIKWDFLIIILSVLEENRPCLY